MRNKGHGLRVQLLPSLQPHMLSEAAGRCQSRLGVLRRGTERSRERATELSDETVHETGTRSSESHTAFERIESSADLSLAHAVRLRRAGLADLVGCRAPTNLG